MLITTSKENLNTAIAAVQKAVNPKSIIQSYSCIKMEIHGDRATLTGAGLDVIIECTVPVQTEREGQALVSAKNFGDIIRRLPDIPVSIECGQNTGMTIRYDKSIFSLPTVESDDFPVIPVFNHGLSFSVDAETLKKLIRQSCFAASNDEMKGIFTGVLWEIDGEELTLVGTDTHRLAYAKGSIRESGRSDGNNENHGDNKDGGERKGSFIIPAKIAAEIARLIQDEYCLVQKEQNTVFFSFGSIKITSQILEGAFPNYRLVLPKQFITKITVENKRLKDAAERISLFSASDESSSIINLEIAEGGLSLHSRSDIGYGKEEIPVEHEGENLKIAFNSKYITDVFKAVEGEKIRISLSGQLSAGIVEAENDPDFLYLLLPVKV